MYSILWFHASGGKKTQLVWFVSIVSRVHFDPGMSGVSKKDLQKVHFDDLQMFLGSMVQKHAKTLKLREQHGPALPGKRAGSANFYFTNVVKTIIN